MNASLVQLRDGPFPGWASGDGAFVGAIFARLADLLGGFEVEISYDEDIPFIWGEAKGHRFTLIEEPNVNHVEIVFEGGLSEEDYPCLFKCVCHLFPEAESKFEVFRNNPRNLPSS